MHDLFYDRVAFDILNKTEFYILHV